jgi:hypothetical protein
VPFVATSASEVFASMGLDPKADYPLEMRFLIQSVMLDTFTAQYEGAARESAVFVVDRTPLDLASYMLADVNRSELADKPDVARLINAYVGECLKATTRFFSEVYLVQPGIKVTEEKGKAPGCPAYMEHLNTILIGLAHDERSMVSCYPIPREMTNLQARVDFVIETRGNLVEMQELIYPHLWMH